jgi:hypothetical protein
MTEANKREEIDLRMHRMKLDHIHRDLTIKKEDVLHLRRVKEDAEERSRKSIAFRLDSWRLHKTLEDGENSRKKKEAILECKVRAFDYQSTREAKQALQFWKADVYSPFKPLSSCDELTEY